MKCTIWKVVVAIDDDGIARIAEIDGRARYCALFIGID